jgi:Tn3 transposase DDE domain
VRDLAGDFGGRADFSPCSQGGKGLGGRAGTATTSKGRCSGRSATTAPAASIRRASLKAGIVAPSVMWRKLAAYRRQNQLDLALPELGRIKRTLFMLDWLESPELRRRCHAGRNKSEQRHFIAKVISTFKQGPANKAGIADRSAEAQRFRAGEVGRRLCLGNPSAARRYARSGGVARHPIRGCLPPFHLGFFRLIGIARSVVSTPPPAPFCPPLCLPLRAVPR